MEISFTKQVDQGIRGEKRSTRSENISDSETRRRRGEEGGGGGGGTSRQRPSCFEQMD